MVKETRKGSSVSDFDGCGVEDVGERERPWDKEEKATRPSFKALIRTISPLVIWAVCLVICMGVW